MLDAEFFDVGVRNPDIEEVAAPWTQRKKALALAAFRTAGVHTTPRLLSRRSLFSASGEQRAARALPPV